MKLLGILSFYLTWPGLFFVTQKTVRVRAKVIHGGQMILVKNFYGPGVWQLPGGGLKRGESYIDAAKREVREELAIDLPENDIKIVSDSVINYKIRGLKFNYVVAEVTLLSRPEIKKSLEISEYRWFELGSDEIPNYAT